MPRRKYSTFADDPEAPVDANGNRRVATRARRFSAPERHESVSSLKSDYSEEDDGEATPLLNQLVAGVVPPKDSAKFVW